MLLGGALMLLAGYLHDLYIGTWSLFYLLLIAQSFFGSANFTVVGPYMVDTKLKIY
jgi:hypothetical protein